MTYSYSNRVTTVKLFGLLRLLKIWKASVYKLVVKELLLFCVLYASASLIYRLGLKSARQKKQFERIVVLSGTFDTILPVTFVLGFYVSVVVQRWWSQFMHIPWPDRFMSYISTMIPGADEAATMLRRTVVRYLLLAEVLLLMTVSAPIKKRFPTLDSLVKQGLMTKAEADIYESEDVPKLSTKFWIPTEWCAMLFGRARREKKIKDSYTLAVLLNELSNYKTCLYTIFFYDWISLPLVYTQVATVAVYGLYFNTVISRQYINGTSVMEDFGPEVGSKYSIDLYVPLDTLLQLFFYLGWLKVAEQMMNPMGEDDDDFECNFIIDRNLKVGLFAVDRMQRMEPPLVKDVWWQSNDPHLHYTQATEKFALNGGWFGSTANLTVHPDQQQQQQQQHGATCQLPDIPENSSNQGDDVDGGESYLGSNLSMGNPPVVDRRRSTRVSTDLGTTVFGPRRRSDKRAGSDSQPGSPEPLKESPVASSPFQFPSKSHVHHHPVQHQVSDTSGTGRLPQTVELSEPRRVQPKTRSGSGNKDDNKDSAVLLQPHDKEKV